MGQVQGKVAIITGGASGIGAACAEILAREGASVLATDIDDIGGAAVADKIKAEGGAALYRHQDVTHEAAWPEIIGAAEKHFGRLDILVANAGIGVIGPVVDMSLADWRRQMAVNLDGVFLSVKHAIPAMRRAGGGSIVIMSSVAGLRGSAGFGAYCASKGGVRLLAKAVAMDCAAARDNIRVNTVHPGVIDTPIWTRMPGVSPDPHAIAKLAVPLGVAGSAEDIANGVLFLASDASRHMTGAELVIDGGMTGGTMPRR